MQGRTISPQLSKMLASLAEMATQLEPVAPNPAEAVHMQSPGSFASLRRAPFRDMRRGPAVRPFVIVSRPGRAILH